MVVAHRGAACVSGGRMSDMQPVITSVSSGCSAHRPEPLTVVVVVHRPHTVPSSR